MVARAAGQWKGIQSSYGKRLYEEFGRHESLQSCVKKHKEAGCPSPEYLGALEWLLLHHTPEVAEREDRDPLDVLLTTLYLGCCDVEEFVKAVVMCLEDDPVVGQRLQEAFKEFDHAVNQAFTARVSSKGGCNDLTYVYLYTPTPTPTPPTLVYTHYHHHHKLQCAPIP